jgi:dihydroorotate dehydrogenase (fumarate)
VIKQLLAGAKAVQIVSALYRNGTECIKLMLADLEEWIQNINMSIEQLGGNESDKPVICLYERVSL